MRSFSALSVIMCQSVMCTWFAGAHPEWSRCKSVIDAESTSSQVRPIMVVWSCGLSDDRLSPLRSPDPFGGLTTHSIVTGVNNAKSMWARSWCISVSCKSDCVVMVQVCVSLEDRLLGMEKIEGARRLKSASCWFRTE